VAIPPRLVKKLNKSMIISVELDLAPKKWNKTLSPINRFSEQIHNQSGKVQFQEVIAHEKVAEGARIVNDTQTKPICFAYLSLWETQHSVLLGYVKRLRLYWSGAISNEHYYMKGRTRRPKFDVPWQNSAQPEQFFRQSNIIPQRQYSYSKPSGGNSQELWTYLKKSECRMNNADRPDREKKSSQEKKKKKKKKKTNNTKKGIQSILNDRCEEPLRIRT